MDCSTEKKLTILDPTSNIIYTFTLDEADYVRAQEDMYFASQLLESAKNGENKENVTGPSSDMSKTPTTLSPDQNQKHVWQYNETLCLIKSMENHFDDLKHPRKRKYVYENVANDLISAGYSTNSNSCQNKWKSLVRSYSMAKDNKHKTGRGPSRFHFFEEIDAFLGTKPSHNCEHSLESGTEENSSGSTEVSNVANAIGEQDDKDADKDPADSDTSEIGFEDINSSTMTQNAILPKAEGIKGKQGKKRMRTNYEGYLLEKSKIEEQKNKRHAERMKIEQMKLELEEQKLNLLREYLKK